MVYSVFLTLLESDLVILFSLENIPMMFIFKAIGM